MGANKRAWTMADVDRGKVQPRARSKSKPVRRFSEEAKEKLDAWVRSEQPRAKGRLTWDMLSAVAARAKMRARLKVEREASSKRIADLEMFLTSTKAANSALKAEIDVLRTNFESRVAAAIEEHAETKVSMREQDLAADRDRLRAALLEARYATTSIVTAMVTRLSEGG